MTNLRTVLLIYSRGFGCWKHGAARHKIISLYRLSHNPIHGFRVYTIFLLFHVGYGMGTYKGN